MKKYLKVYFVRIGVSAEGEFMDDKSPWWLNVTDWLTVKGCVLWLLFLSGGISPFEVIMYQLNLGISQTLKEPNCKQASEIL